MQPWTIRSLHLPGATIPQVQIWSSLTFYTKLAEPPAIPDDVAKKIVEADPALASTTGELDLSKFDVRNSLYEVLEKYSYVQQLAETEKTALVDKVKAALSGVRLFLDASTIIFIYRMSLRNSKHSSTKQRERGLSYQRAPLAITLARVMVHSPLRCRRISCRRRLSVWRR